jgi:glycosyltransferase involved in cell wall biosynthesis
MNNKLKQIAVVFDGRLISEFPTGISRYSIALLEFYCSVFDPSQVAVLLNTAAPSSLPANVKVIRSSTQPFSLSSLLELHKVLVKFRPMFFHSPFYSNTLIKVRGVRYITTVHDLMFLLVPNFFGEARLRNWLGRFYYRAMVKVALRNSDLVLSVSDTTKEDVRTFFNTESVVVKNGIRPMKRYISQTDAERLLSEIQVERHNFWLYVGNFRPHKGLSTLLAALEVSRIGLPLVICGRPLSGYQMPKFDHLPQVKVVDADDVALSILYATCKATIVPSIYEGFGIPVIEALASGSRVISSNGGALKEFNFSGVSFFSPGDIQALSALLASCDIERHAYPDPNQIIAEFSWNKTLQPLERALFEMFHIDLPSR